MKIFFVQFSVYSCHLFSISSASVRSLTFLSFIVPIFAWVIPLVTNFLEEILCYLLGFLIFWSNYHVHSCCHFSISVQLFTSCCFLFLCQWTLIFLLIYITFLLWTFSTYRVASSTRNILPDGKQPIIRSYPLHTQYILKYVLRRQTLKIFAGWSFQT